mmetsp:Transcript_95598/g.213961  ORF Transcript_95598/g.213961 Transcript_95598/m.213961 type:complete len:982 (+) Transcript_95598:195-3140(+)
MLRGSRQPPSLWVRGSRPLQHSAGVVSPWCPQLPPEQPTSPSSGSTARPGSASPTEPPGCTAASASRSGSLSRPEPGAGPAAGEVTPEVGRHSDACRRVAGRWEVARGDPLQVQVFRRHGEAPPAGWTALDTSSPLGSDSHTPRSRNKALLHRRMLTAEEKLRRREQPSDDAVAAEPEPSCRQSATSGRRPAELELSARRAFQHLCGADAGGGGVRLGFQPEKWAQAYREVVQPLPLSPRQPLTSKASKEEEEDDVEESQGVHARRRPKPQSQGGYRQGARPAARRPQSQGGTCERPANRHLGGRSRLPLALPLQRRPSQGSTKRGSASLGSTPEVEGGTPASAAGSIGGGSDAFGMSRAGDEDEGLAGLSFDPWAESAFGVGWESRPAPADVIEVTVTPEVAPPRLITLLQSVFAGRPPVLLFSRLPEGSPGLSRVLTAADFAAGGPPKMYFCHTKETHEYNAVLNTLRKGGLYRARSQSGKWSLCWGGIPKPEQLRGFHPFQVMNHFPGSWQLGRKDLMWRNIYRLQRKAPKQFNITPRSYVLPEDFRSWERDREMHQNAFWIWKPVNSSCGRGIRLLRSTIEPGVEKALQKRPGVVQRYIDRPLLIDGYKFDLRLYVVVTSFDPLKAYLSTEGLVRLATEKYSNSSRMLDHRTMHLTNYSVNKCSNAYVKNLDTGGSRSAGATGVAGAESGSEGEGGEEMEDGENEDEDEEDDGVHAEGVAEADDDGRPQSKWSMPQLRTYFAERSLDFELMMSRIKDLIVKALIAVEPVVVGYWHQGANFQGGTCGQALRGLGPNQTCFEIYGFDVMVDDSLTPWLLEVNTAPSLSSSSPLDKRIKTQLIADAITLVGLRPFDHKHIDKAMREERESQVFGLQPKVQGLPKSHTIQSLGTCSLRDLGEAEWTTILDTHDEFMRRGSLERIFPTRESDEKYSELFVTPRYANLVLAKWLQEGGAACFGPGAEHALPPWVPKLVSSEEI